MSSLGLRYLTDIASKPGLPVNLPYFWKFMLGVPSKESGFVDAGNKLVDDLFHDITNYYLDKDIRTCNMFQKHLYRLIKFRYYSGFPTLTATRQTELKTLGFIYPNTDGTPGIDYKYNFTDYEPRTIGVIADSFYNPTIMVKQDVNFELDNGTMTFLFNPVEGDASFFWTSNTYTTSWGETIAIQECNLIAMNLEMWESPLWEDYGCLVYSSEYDPTSETEQEYRQKIIGLFLLFYNGMKINVLNAAVNTMLGLPVFLYEHELIKLITSTEIITDKSTYVYDITIPLHPKVVKGQVMNQFDTVHNVVEITDHVTDLDWINGKSLPDFLFITPGTVNMNPTIDCTTTQDIKQGPPPFVMHEVGGPVAIVMDNVGLDGLTWNNSDETKLYYIAQFRNNVKEFSIKLYSDSAGVNLVAEGSGRVHSVTPTYISIEERYDSGLSGIIRVTDPGSDELVTIDAGRYFEQSNRYDDTLDLHFDLFNIVPMYVPGESYLQAYTNNYYIWEKYFKTVIFNIKLLVNYITFDRLEELGIIDEVLPLNVYYLKTHQLDFIEDLNITDTFTDDVDITYLDPPS